MCGIVPIVTKYEKASMMNSSIHSRRRSPSQRTSLWSLLFLTFALLFSACSTEPQVSNGHSDENITSETQVQLNSASSQKEASELMKQRLKEYEDLLAELKQAGQPTNTYEQKQATYK